MQQKGDNFMSGTNQYYDPNIFMQSTNLTIKVAYMYYYEKLRQQEIAEKLEISVSTVSRILKKAKEQEIVRFTIGSNYLECLELENKIQEYFHLKEVIVAPAPKDEVGGDDMKKLVGLEGARYLQRIVTDCDVLGVAYGETVWYVYNYLNPSQRKNMEFVTLHGTLYHENNKLDGSWLVPRIAKAFGGRYYTINCKGIQKDRESVLCLLRNPDIKRTFEQLSNITISISGVGMVYPEKSSVLVRGDYLTEEEIHELEAAGACGDILLRFFDKEGKECDTSLRSRIIGIPYEHYKRIPNKVVVAAGEAKTMAVLGLLRNDMVDTLIIDQGLARGLAKAI